MADKKFYIIPNQRTITAGIKEKGSNFTCPANTIMTGRYHKGDENGQTQYEYATLMAVDESDNPVAGTITVEDVRWEASFKESSGSGFDAPGNRVIVGRIHTGDENGQTQYATALVKIDGKTTLLEEGLNSSSIKESSGIWFKTDAYRVMTGRHHSGDENGQTYYTSAKIVIPASFTAPAPEGTIIVPDQRTVSATMTESASSFMCPAGTVMTGRMHTGDENGTTQYQYATLKAINSKGEIVVGNITIEDIKWENPIKESGTWFNAGANRIIVGRKHDGDENGYTQYATGVVKFNGHATYVSDILCSSKIKESSGIWFRTATNRIITGRVRGEDENGNSFFNTGIITTEPQEEKDKIKVFVVLNTGENYYPMDPLQFIQRSRFRRHNAGGKDDGYSRVRGGFVNGNDEHTSEFYNIPVSTINSYHLNDINKNLRPRDDNSLGIGEVFLQPDDHPTGNANPTGNISVFTYSSYVTENGTTRERREYWFFYGYNDVDTGMFQGSHQGDWERITLDIVNNRMEGVWLDQHGHSKYYTLDQLDVTESNGIQVLRIFSARGTHTTYEKVGQFKREDPLLSHDHTDNGYQWEITKKVEQLADQPWILYAGAWGEVGMFDFTTGPLGPWYKRMDI